MEIFMEKGRASCDGERRGRTYDVAMQPPRRIKLGPADPVSSSSSSHCCLQECVDSLALSIYRQIYGPELEDASSVLLLARSAIGWRKEARVGRALASSVQCNRRNQRAPNAHMPSESPCFTASSRLRAELISIWIPEVPDGPLPTPSTLAIRCSDHGLLACAPSLLCMRLHALHRSPFTPCVIRLPPHRCAYPHSCVCVRTPLINLDLISLHAPYASPPPPAPVLSCAPHSDPEFDLVQLHCCLRCVRDHRPVFFLELL
ncbi:hypothetical protein B0H13DRAFT_2358151 [Mycena leptocephala]|nr:hypothetical protein B0H13DRAFT_2358151 [Mycena leptocephala]